MPDRLRSPTMRLRALASETVANCRARALFTVALVGALASLTVTVFVVEANAARDITAYERDLRADGYATLVVEHSNQIISAPFTASDCEALGATPAVNGAVGSREPVPYRLWGRGGPAVPVRAVVGDIVGFLAATNPELSNTWRTAQIFVDDQSSAAAGPGEQALWLGSADGVQAELAITVDLGLFGSGSTGNLVAADATAGPIGSCALLVALDRRDAVAASTAVALPSLQGFSQRWALSNADRFEAPQWRFEHRPSRWYWVAGAAGFVVAWLLVLRLRRNEYALYAVSGLTSREVTALAGLELLTVVGLAAIAAAAVIGGALLRTGLPAQFALVGLGSSTRMLIVVGIAASAWNWQQARSTATSTLATLKDR